MYCRKCGSELHSDAKFCSKCGMDAGVDISKNAIPNGKFTLSKRKIILITAYSCVAILCAVVFFVFRETPEKRVVKALERMQKTEQLDMSININADINFAGSSIPLEQYIEIQSDATEADNPLSAMKSTTYMDSNTYVVNAYYKDGFSYAQSEDNKIKTPIDFEEFQNQYTKSMKDLFIDPSRDVSNANILEGDNGEVYATFYIDGKQFANVVSTLLHEWSGELNVNMDSDSLGCLYVIIDKDDTISQMQFDYTFSMDCYGSTVTVIYQAIYFYNEIDENFEIVFPDDLDTYDGR